MLRWRRESYDASAASMVALSLRAACNRSSLTLVAEVETSMRPMRLERTMAHSGASGERNHRRSFGMVKSGPSFSAIVATCSGAFAN